MNDMNELTRLLRAAATDMPDNPRRAEDLARRVAVRHRRRVRTAVVAGLTAAAVAAVAVVVGLGLGRDTDAATIVPATTPTATTDTTTTPVVTTPATTSVPVVTPSLPAPAPADESRRIELFGGVSLVPPKGWATSYLTSAEHDMAVCLTPPAAQPRMNWMCDGGILVESGTVVGNEGRPFEAHQDGGWYPGTGQSACPTPPEDGVNGVVNEVWSGDPGTEQGRSLVAQGSWEAAGLTGAYDEWAAHCDNGFGFHPRSWYLPQVPFRALDFMGHPQADADLLASIRIGSDESRRMHFHGGISLVPPKGWTRYWDDRAPSGQAVAAHDRWVCLEPSTYNRMTTDARCSGILIEAGAVTGQGGQPFQAHQDAGWLIDTSTVGCPRQPADSRSTAADPVVPGAPGDTSPDAGAPVEQGAWNVAGQAGAYDRWAAHCADDGYTFHPRSWYLPGIPFRVLDYTGQHPAEVEKLLTTIRIG